MARRKRDTRTAFQVPALSVGVVLAFLVCMLLFLWIIIVLVRLVYG
ncbi:hypothetical protein [Xiamenia xianingshaonis]|uniref:Uncharacterized protein n=1 Tax=Xiamenia xianingshaonis TaxID=2682776 RepID=A0A9E6MQ81_9ACTN|nr:hypothetical protein [Xiamenia xianingshaonis]QTU84408.1 hypothetical protein J7S26_00230 [Xiamenia xianingshaonis]